MSIDRVNYSVDSVNIHFIINDVATCNDIRIALYIFE